MAIKHESNLLGYLDLIDGTSGVYISRQKGKAFFETPGIARLIEELLVAAPYTRAQFARACGMSTESLNAILSTERATDSMLFRLRVGANRTSLLKKTRGTYRDWVRVDEDRAQQLVDAVVKSVRDFYTYVRKKNALDQAGGPLSPLERAQLVAVLDALLIELRAPAVSRSRMSELSRWFGTMMRRTATKKAEEEFQNLGSLAASAIKGLARYLAGKAGIDLF